MSVLVQTVQTSDCKSVDCSLMTFSVGFHDPSLHRSFVHAGQQGTLSRSNAYNRRHAYARPRQPSLQTRTSNMPASTCQHRARRRNMASINNGGNKASNQQTRTAKWTTICSISCICDVSCLDSTLTGICVDVDAGVISVRVA